MITRQSNGKHSGRSDVIVVGAGAAGIGIATTLLHAGVRNVEIVDRHGIAQ
jgi:malic enzyme